MSRKLLNEELNRLTTEEYKDAEKLPLVVVLDNVRSLNNIGSVSEQKKAWTGSISKKPPMRFRH